VIYVKADGFCELEGAFFCDLERGNADAANAAWTIFVSKRESCFDSKESQRRIADRKFGNTLKIACTKSFNPCQS
jgi:hypothetical protein